MSEIKKPLWGIIEGFYGQPWTMAERRRLLDLLATLPPLNTYIYAPKDAPGQRHHWANLPPASFLNAWEKLQRQATTLRVNLGFALNVGSNFSFKPDEIARLKYKYGLIAARGTRLFALLFDDLPLPSMKDPRARGNVGRQQGETTAELWHYLQQNYPTCSLIFCPTVYSYAKTPQKKDLAKDPYLRELARSLPEPISIFWTGNEVISTEIEASDLEELTSIFGRSPIIWDNLFANDYDFRRLYLGPFAGRGTTVVQAIQGLLLNPANQLSLNKIAFRTMAEYLSNPQEYNPDNAFHTALKHWTLELGIGHDTQLARTFQFVAECFYLPHTFGKSIEKTLESAVTQSKLSKLVKNLWRLYATLRQQREKHYHFTLSHFVAALGRELAALHKVRDREEFDIGSFHQGNIFWQLHRLQAKND